MSTQQLQPTITFIIPFQSKENFLIEQINTVFKFSELYSGFCELIITSDGKEDALLKLAWLAMKLNKINHPHVRTKIIRYTSQISINKLIETSMKHALGQKIIIATDNAKKIDVSQIRNSDVLQRPVLTVQYFLNTKILEELSKQIH